MTTEKASQVFQETIEVGSPTARASEVFSEAITVGTPTERGSQVFKEAMRNVSPTAQAYQSFVEIMGQPGNVRAYQSFVEVMFPNPPPPDVSGFEFIQTVISQYQASPIILTLVSNMSAYINPAYNFDQFYDLIWNIDTAQGYGLDVWGRIVGVNRVLKIITGTYFGFANTARTTASGQPFNQAVFYNGSFITSNVSLDDLTYRQLILAKAMYNITDGSIPAINSILISLFGADGPFPIAGDSYVTDDGSMTMTYSFGAAPDSIAAAVIYQSGVLPKPVGVNATVVIR